MEKHKEKAVGLLKATKAERLYMNPKGEFFTKENLAKNSLKKDEKLEVFEANADAKTDNNDDTSDVLDKIQEIEDTNVLYGMLDAEKEGENSEKMIKAIEQRIKELENAE